MEGSYWWSNAKTGLGCQRRIGNLGSGWLLASRETGRDIIWRCPEN